MTISQGQHNLIVRLNNAIEVSRSMRVFGFRLQRIKRGKWIYSDKDGIVGTFKISLDESHPDKVVYVEDDIS